MTIDANEAVEFEMVESEATQDLATERGIPERSTASQTWYKFRQHRLATIAVVGLILLYLMAVFAEFISPGTAETRFPDAKDHPPQVVQVVYDGQLVPPFVYGTTRAIDEETLRVTYEVNPDERFELCAFCTGPEYLMWGVIPSNVHLIGVVDTGSELLLAGSDSQGRDLLSRVIYGSRISLTFGVVGVALTLVLGLIMGGISGYFGGRVDSAIQRLIDLIVCIPTIPLWMALAAALPRNWSSVQIYFGMIVVFALIGWAGLARAVRGKVLSVREEDYVLAARLSGAGAGRIIGRHILPSLTTLVIVNATLAIPATILGETALSFIGLGIQPPAVSWGVLLQDAQSITSLAHSPWLLLPAFFVVITVILFNFVGDGLRDAADPNTA